MTKRSIPGLKDENGIYYKDISPLDGHVPPATPPLDPDAPAVLSIDYQLEQGLIVIDRLMRRIKSEIRSGEPIPRETVQNLHDVMRMLHELKKKEAEILDKMSLEDLKKAAENK